MKVSLDGQVVDLTEWFAEGSKQQKEYIDKLIEKYYIRLKLKQTIQMIEKILNEKS